MIVSCYFLGTTYHIKPVSDIASEVVEVLQLFQGKVCLVVEELSCLIEQGQQWLLVRGDVIVESLKIIPLVSK